MADDSLITPDLLRALALKESSGGTRLLGDKGLVNKAYGTYQIRKPAYLDVVRLRKELADVPFSQVQSDQQMNETFARAYLSVLANEYGLKDIDSLLMGYNAGPTAVRRGKVPPSAQTYSHEVQQLMQKGR